MHDSYLTFPMYRGCVCPAPLCTACIRQAMDTCRYKPEYPIRLGMGIISAWKSSHILVVDDDREIRTLLADYLDANGCKTVTAGDGRECGMCWRPPASICRARLDLAGEDGLTLCRNCVRNQPAVIMLTAREQRSTEFSDLKWALTIICPALRATRATCPNPSVLRRTQALPPTSTHPRLTAFVSSAGARSDGAHLVNPQGSSSLCPVRNSACSRYFSNTQPRAQPDQLLN